MYADLMKEFGINEYETHHVEKPPQEIRERKKSKIEEGYEDDRGVWIRHSSFDFVQEMARVSGREQNAVLKMCIDLIRRECHVTHVPGGKIEETLVEIASRWECYCDQCDRLEEYVAKQKEAARQENEEKVERSKKKRDQRLNRIMKNKEEGSSELWSEDQEARQVYLGHRGYGSELLMNAKKTAESLYGDLINIRACIIWCLMCHSVAIQRLIRCGKFVSDRYRVNLRYAPIHHKVLEEFVHCIDPLKNAFYTCQTSAFNFVDTIRHMVEQGGVNHYVTIILKVPRILETKRIEKMHT